MKQERGQTWHETIRKEREQQGHRVIAWEVLAEGAIVSVSTGPSCTGVSVYLFGGPDKPEQIKESPYMLLREGVSNTFPQLRSYHSCPSKDEYEGVIKQPEPWMEEGRAFVSALRNY